MLYKYGDFRGVLFNLFSYILGAFLIKQLFHSCLLDMRLVIANSALRVSLPIYHLTLTLHTAGARVI